MTECVSAQFVVEFLLSGAHRFLSFQSLFLSVSEFDFISLFAVYRLPRCSLNDNPHTHIVRSVFSNKQPSRKTNEKYLMECTDKRNTKQNGTSYCVHVCVCVSVFILRAV